MLKVIYIANARIPTEKAHGKQIIKTVEALANFFPSIELWVPRREQVEYFKKKDIFNFYGVKKNFQVRFFSTVDLLLKLKNFPSVVQAPFFFLQEASFIFSLAFSAPAFDLVYSRSLLAALTLKVTTGKKAIYEAHNLTSNQYIRKFYSLLSNYLDGVVVISEGLKNDHETLGIKRRILVAPDGVDQEQFTKRKKRPESNPKTTIVYTGSLQIGKGVDDLVVAAALLPQEKYQIKIVGGFFSGNDKERLMGLISEKSAQNVELTGYVSPDKIPNILSSADILVLPNSARDISDRKYTSPMKLFEYLASGTPIIASATEANKEILHDDQNALFFEPDNPIDLREKIESLTRNKQLQKKLSINAVKTAKRYTWHERAKKIAQFIREL